MWVSKRQSSFDCRDATTHKNRTLLQRTRFLMRPDKNLLQQSLWPKDEPLAYSHMVMIWLTEKIVDYYVLDEGDSSFFPQHKLNLLALSL